MRLLDLEQAYQREKGEDYQSVNQLLDFYQRKYINCDIDISTYRNAYHFLHDQGAVSSHEYME